MRTHHRWLPLAGLGRVTCSICSEPFTVERPAATTLHYLWRRSPRHGWHASQRPINVCTECAKLGKLTKATYPKALVTLRLPLDLSRRQPGECEACGVPVLVEPDARRRRVYCSNACRVALAKAAKSVPAPVTRHCAVCEVEYQPSRSDSRYCSNACRQKAARQRARDLRNA